MLESVTFDYYLIQLQDYPWGGIELRQVADIPWRGGFGGIIACFVQLFLSLIPLIIPCDSASRLSSQLGYVADCDGGLLP